MTPESGSSSSSPSKSSSKEPCPDCGGRGTVAFANDVLTCAACDGKGTLSSGDASK